MKKNITILILSIIVIVLTVTTIDLYNKLNNENDIETEIQQRKEVKDNNTTNEIIAESEEDIIEYIEEVDKNVDKILLKENITEKEKNTLKESFILLTDFIFYEGEIKGVKFSELRSDIKENIIELYEKIDNKIESKYPNYKETIKDKGIKKYTNVKEKVLETKNSILEEYKNKVGQEGYDIVVDTYNDGKEDMKNVYEEYKPYISEGAEKGKNILQTIKEKISDWYQEYKEG